MNFSIGIDCVEIERIQKVLDNPKLLNRIFTKKEIEYCLGKANPKKHLAARYAGKEALIKAFSDQDIQIAMSNIEIINNHKGVPQARVEGIKDFAIKISLSHCKNFAIAQALLINNSPSKPLPNQKSIN